MLRIECPFCRTHNGKGKPKFRYHGNGNGDRLAHCDPVELPPHLRSKAKSLRYTIVEPSEQPRKPVEPPALSTLPDCLQRLLR